MVIYEKYYQNIGIFEELLKRNLVSITIQSARFHHYVLQKYYTENSHNALK